MFHADDISFFIGMVNDFDYFAEADVMLHDS
jgi:hypothetical protein